MDPYCKVLLSSIQNVLALVRSPPTVQGNVYIIS